MENFLVLGLTLRTLGEVIIGLSIIRVHIRIMQEHKLDKKVYRSIHKEKFWAVVGVALIIVGYFLEVAHINGGGLL
jgi:uncharacterized membrane protein YidH (DUF202 family)